MAKKTDYLNANLTYEDTFSSVVETVNEIQYDLATVVVTTAPVAQPNLDNGGQTNGNTHINGIFSANTATAIDGIRGGTVSTSDTLHVLSDASFEGANVVIQSGTDTYIKDEIFVSANAAFTGNNVTINISRTLSATAANNVVINAPDIDVDSANITIGTTGADQVTINSDVDMTANVVIGSNTEDQFTVNADADFNATVNVDGDVTLNANTTIGSDVNDLLTVQAAADFNQSLNVDGIVTLNANVAIGDDVGDELLSVFAAAEFYDNVTIGDASTDTLTINANTIVNNQMTIGSDGTDTLMVNSATTFSGNVTIGDTADGADTLTVNSNTTFTDDVVIEETLVANGNVTLGDDIATDTVTHTANTVLQGELHVTGQTKLNGNATIGDASTDTMTVEATTTFKANVTIGDTADGADTLTVNANTFFTDDVDIEETLTVDGNITLGVNGDVTMTVNADTTFNDDVAIVQTLTVDGNVQLGNNTTDDTLTVTAVTNLQANTTIGAAATDQLTVNANTDFNTDVHVDGNTYLNGNATIGDAATDLLTVNANTVVNNDMVIGSDDTDTLTVNSNTFFTDDVDIEETLTVDGNVTLGTVNAANAELTDTTLTVNSNTTINYDATVNGTFNTTGDTEIGNASTDTLDVNATSDFNAAVNIDGILTTTNSATIGSDSADLLTVNATANLVSNTTIGSVVDVGGTPTPSILTVEATTTFKTDVTIGDAETDNLTVNSNTTFTDDVKIEETLTVDGSVQLGNNTATDALTVNATVTFNGNTTIGSASDDTLTVESTTTFKNNVTIGDSTEGADSLTVNANTDFTDDVRISETLNVTGAVSFANTLGVTGASTFANTVSVTGAITGSDTLTIAGTTTLNGDVDLGDAATDTITFTGEVDSNIIPSANVTYNLGSATDQWDNIYTEDAHVTANTNTGKVVINQADAEIVVSTLDGDTAAHGTLTVQFDHANTSVANVETVTFTSTTVEPVTNEGISLGTNTKNFKEGYIADSHIHKIDTDIVSSNTITVKVDDTTDSAVIEIHLENDLDTNGDPIGTKSSVIDITADSTNVIGPFTVSGAVTLGDAETDLHTINGDTTFTHDVVVQKTFTANGNVTLGDANTDTLSVAANTTFSDKVVINKTLEVDGSATFETGLTLGTSTTVGHIVPSANTANSEGDVTNGWSNIGSSTKYFRNIYVDTINSPNFNLHDLNNVDSDALPGNDDHQKVYAWSNTANEFQLTTVAALAGSGIGVTDLRDVNDTTLANNDIIIVTDSTSGTPFQNVKLEMNLISDATVKGGASASYSIGVGEGALGALLAGGDYNTALGKNALGGTTTGDNNVGLGSGAGSNLTTGSGNIYIGKGVAASSTSASNEIVIGTSAITDLKLGTIVTANSTVFSVNTNRSVDLGTTVMDSASAKNFTVDPESGGGIAHLYLKGQIDQAENANGQAATKISFMAPPAGSNTPTLTYASINTGTIQNDSGNTATRFYISAASATDAGTSGTILDYYGSTGTLTLNEGVVVKSSAVELNYGSTKVLETLSDGVKVTGNFTVTGNLEVQGTRTFINTTTLEVEDNIITLNKGYTGDPEGVGAVEEDAGIEVDRGDAANVSLIWDESDNRWAFTNDGSNYNTLPTNAEQHKFKTITINDNAAVTSTDIIADERTDTLTIKTLPSIIEVQDSDDIATVGIVIEANATSDTITLKHADTSTIKTASNTGVIGTSGISSITVDDYGHVTSATEATFDNYVKWTLSANSVDYSVNSEQTVTMVDQDGISTYLSGADNQELNILNTKPFDKLVIKGNAATTKDINNSDQINFIGNTDITVSVSNTSATNFTVDIDHDDITRTDTTSTASPNHSADFTVVDSVTTSNTGHVTAVNVKTVTMPDIYSLPTASATVKGGVKVGTGLSIDTNAVLSVDSFAMHRIIVTQTSTSTYSFTASTGNYSVPFNTREHYDSGVYTHDINTAPEEIQVDVSGTYTINYMVGINPTNAGRSVVEAQVYVNGSPLPYVAKSYERGNSYGDDMVVQQTLPPIDLAENDKIKLIVRVHFEDATSTYNINPTETTLSVLKVGTEAPGNTWRPIDDVPANGATTTSVSSNWAFDHRAGDGTITSGSKGQASNVSPGYGGSFAIPRITYDSSGHLTAASDVIITLPAADAVDTLDAVTSAGNTTTNNITVGQIDLKNSSPTLDLIKSGASVWLGGVGSMTFRAETNNQLFGEIVTKVANTSTTAAEGYMEFYVAEDNAHTRYLTLDGSSQQAIFNKNVYLNTGVNLVFEGGTSNSNETTLTVTNPSADRTITLPDASGTVALTSDLTSFLTAESDTLATVTGRGATTNTAISVANTVTMNDLTFPTNADIVTTAGGQLWYKGFNSANDVDGKATFVIGNSSYDFDNNAVSTLELRQYGYSANVGPTFTFENLSRNRITFIDKQKRTATSGDATSYDVPMAEIVQGTTYLAGSGKQQNGILTLQTYNSSNTVSGSIVTSDQIKIGDGLIKLTTNDGNVSENIQFWQAGSRPETSWYVGTEKYFSIENDLNGDTFINSHSTTLGSGDITFVVADDRYISFTDAGSGAGTVYIQPSKSTILSSIGTLESQLELFSTNRDIRIAGADSSDWLRFDASSTVTKAIISSDSLLIQSENDAAYNTQIGGYDIRLNVYNSAGRLNLLSAGTERGSFDFGTANIVSLYVGSNNGVLNTTWSGNDMTVQGDITTLSDARTKENVETIDNALETVVSLRGVRYNKIGEEDRKVGVIAQEVEEVLPEVVKTNDEGMKSVDYGKMVGVLIEAMKEQQEQIEALKAEIAELKQ